MSLKKFRRRLAEEITSRGIEISTEKLDALCVHYGLLCKWNARIRLVGTVEPERAALELFTDSFIAGEFARKLVPGSRGPEAGAAGTGKPLKALDIGSGAGLPGVPVKTLMREWNLTLIDADTKRVSFLKELVRELGLSDTLVERGRAETLAHEPNYRESFDLAFCRAVAAPRIACELAVPFLKVGGSFILQTTEKIYAEEAEKISETTLVLGATTGPSASYTLTPTSEQRMLIQIKKTAETPAEFPRNFKSIKRKPLA